jgi:hypothetical protein
MISFRQYINEISANLDLIDMLKTPSYSSRASSKLIPKTDSFKVIPIKLGYDIYTVFKRYVSPKYKLAEELLDRRGDSVSWVTVKASNEELFNLKELAQNIVENAPEHSTTRPSYTNQEREIAVAKFYIGKIEELLSGSER